MAASWRAPFEKGRDGVLESQQSAGLFLLLKAAVFHEADAGGELRLVQSGAQSTNRIRAAQTRGQLENTFRKFVNARNVRTTTAQQHTAAQIIQQSLGIQFLLDKLENLFQARRHNSAQMLQIDR